MKSLNKNTVQILSFGIVLRILGFAIIALLAIVNGCGEQPSSSTTNPETNPVEFVPTSPISVTVTKWYQGHLAAISLTYDHGVRWLSEHEKLIQNIVLEEKVPMDFDFTNSDLDEWPARRAYYFNTLLPSGIKVFGHGYEHVNSDALPEDSALQNFRQCYQDMKSMGIKPVAYAYPGGYCSLESTRRALAASGFLSGRRFTGLDYADPYICPNDELVPKDWYDLPSLVMYSYEYTNGDPRTVHNTVGLIPFLDEALRRRSWLITTYHEIKDGPGGTYHVQDFRNDIQAIKARDFWIASFTDATLYLRERANARLEFSPEFAADGSFSSARLLLSDNLPNTLYNHPLTVRLSMPEAMLGQRLRVTQDGREVVSAIIASSMLLSLQPNERPYILHVL